MLRLGMFLLSLLMVACTQTNSDQTFAVEAIGDGIYVHHGEHLDIDVGYQGDICNISFIVGSKGVAVIDTGGSLKVGQQLRAAIKNVTDKPILYVINTHVHPDHIFGNAAFVDVGTPPTFVGHEKLADAMTLREEAYEKLNAQYLGHDAKGTVLVKPSLQISGPAILDLGDRKLSITPYANAHTNTDITVIDIKTGTLFTGDLLFIERTPVLEGDIKGLITTIDTLKTYDVKQVVPGHGPVAKDWVQALNNEQRYLNAMLTDIREIIANDGTMEDAMDNAAAREKPNWLLFDIANRRNVNTIYPALEWE
jgi:quinoprotein relay system zinc metallohydrolase 2